MTDFNPKPIQGPWRASEPTMVSESDGGRDLRYFGRSIRTQMLESRITGRTVDGDPFGICVLQCIGFETDTELAGRELAQMVFNAEYLTSLPEMHRLLKRAVALLDEGSPEHEAALEQEAEDAANDERHPSAQGMRDDFVTQARDVLGRFD